MKHKCSLKRFLSLLLAMGIIIASALPSTGQRVLAADASASAAESLVAHYKFDGNFKDTSSDSTGTAEGGAAPTLTSDSVRGQVMKSGSGFSWIKTSNPLYEQEGLDGFTVGAWVKANAVDTFNGIWSFASGNGNTNGFFGMSTNGSLYFNDNPSNPTYQDMKEFGGTITVGDWAYITVVMDEEKISMYKDGLLAKELIPSTPSDSFLVGEGAPYMLNFVSQQQFLYFGTASPHYWASGDFYLDDLKVYDKALSGVEVLGEYLADVVTAQAFVDADSEALTLPESVIDNLELPATGSSGYTTITWSSGNKAVIEDDGTVTRPSAETTVELTANVSLGQARKTKTISVKVPASDDSSDLAYYKEQLSLRAGYIASDLSLPTSIGKAEISWGSSNGSVLTVVDGTAKVTRPADTNAKVTLKATLSLGTATETKEFSLVVLAQGANVATYVSNDPALSTESLKGQAGGMKIAAEEEDGSYAVLHKNQPIMYTALGAKAYAAPALFRMADGTFGLVAGDGGSNGTILLYTSDDLIDYANERQVTLPGLSSIQKLSCVYDLTEKQYLLYAEDQSGVVHTYTSSDLTDFASTETPAGFSFAAVQNAPSDAVWASELALTQAEYDKLTAKFTNPYNTELTGKVPEEVTVAVGGDAEAALDAAVGSLNATYSNGETATYTVRWNVDDLEEVDTSRPGNEYTIRGTIGGSTYYTEALEPLIEERADPCIAYDAKRDCYYFTATYPLNGKDGADGNDRLVIRKADTIEGLATAEEYVIWDESEVVGFEQFIWAPELRYIGGSWYFLSTAALDGTGYSFNLRPFLMKCNNPDDITNPESRGEPQRIKLKAGDTSGLGAMSLDMTYFEVGGKAYYAWADFTRNQANPNGVSSIYLASVDPSDPTQLTSNCVVIAVPEYSWEVQRFVVNEGPSVLLHDGKVYMTFSASGTGSEYCIGLLTADANADLLNPASWTKTPYPIMTSGDFNDELCGPGHNSFTVNEAGDPVIVYHARPTVLHQYHSGDPLYDACRYAYVKPVFFDSEGVPVLNMSDEEFVKGGTSVEVTLKVEGEAQEAEPVLEYNFDEPLQADTAADSAGSNDATLVGGQYVDDPDYGQVLYLDGDTSVGGHDSYLEFPQGFFDDMDSMTISMDVNKVTRTGYTFTFAVGQDRNAYLIFNLTPTEFKLAITTGSYSTEQTASWNGAYPNNSRTWVNMKLVITPDRLSIYRNGELVAENREISISISNLGDNLKAYLGKSFYDEDLYFRGYFDNVKVYNYAMSDWEIQTAYAQEEATRLAMLGDVRRVADTFEIPDADDIRGNITLPAQKDGVSISWTSSNEDVISTAVVEHEGYDSTPAGVVTRGETDKTVTLTAVFSKDGQQSVTKTYDVVVKAKAEPVSEEDYVGYLFVHFTGNEAAASHEQTYFSISTDGLHWTDLNDNQPVLTSTIGESGLRDHYIARSPEGDRYFMIATDLSIYHNAGNWAGAGSDGSHGIVVWESDDLVHWSEPWIAEIAPENAGCTWAPEFIYDEITGEYVVYWSATTIELNENEEITQEYENHAIYYAKTRDFRTFTEPVLYHAGGNDSNGVRIKVIDSTMIEDDGKYYRYTKNESRGIIEIDVADSVLGTFTPIESTTLSTTLPDQQGAVEGPIIFKLNEKDAEGNDQWCLMVDRFARGQGYYPLITTDLASGEFTLLNDGDFTMPSKYRHGYVMPITAAEYDALQSAFGGEDYVSTQKLQEMIEAAEAIDVSLLTEESAAALAAGIAAAEEALEGGFATTAAADAAAAALQDILDDLTYLLTRLEVTPPTKTTYTQGEPLDITGMVVTAIYADGSTANVTANFTVSGYHAQTTGTQTVTVTYTETGVTKTATFTVTVQAAGEEPVAVTGVTLNTGATELTVGQSMLLIATVKPDNATNQAVRWTSSDSDVATVDSDGTVKAVAAGEAIITVTTKDGGKTATCTVIVTEIPVTTYTLTVAGGSGSGSYEAGAQVTITANAPETGMRFKAWEAEGITLTDPTANPLTITMPEGDVTLTATYEKIPETVTTHTVTLNANGGTVTPSTLTVEDGETTVLPTPYRAGSYRFLGWFDASGKQYTAFTPITEDVTLTARWQYTGGSHGDPVEPSKPVEEPEEQPEQPATSYSDVKPADWYAEAVAFVSENGLMDGVGGGRFNPDGAVTRAMVWTVLARMAGEDTNGGATWYSKAQEWAMRTGVSDGTNPTASITREQLAAMLYRYEGSPAVSGDLSAYPDANEVSDWAVDAMVWATEEGVINGIGGKLSPKTGATRAQLATMLMRFCQW